MLEFGFLTSIKHASALFWSHLFLAFDERSTGLRKSAKLDVAVSFLPRIMAATELAACMQHGQDHFERGNLIEVLCAEQSDGVLIAYHAMKLTKKMSTELGL